MGVFVKINPFFPVTCYLVAMESVDALDEEEWWLEPEEREARGRGGKRKNEEGVTNKKKRRKISEMIKLSKVNFNELSSLILIILLIAREH